MKKTITRVLCIVISLIMMLGSFVFADSGKDFSGYEKYVSLGDSIADGIGLPSNNLRGPDQEDKTKVYCYKAEGAYTVLVAQALGISDVDFSQLGCAGMRTVELRSCLDPDYVIPDNYANNFTDGELDIWVKNRFDYIKLVSEADIITLNMCANDIASYALFYLRAELEGQGITDEILDPVIGELEKGGEYTTAIVKLLQYAETAGSYVRAAEAAVKGLMEGYTRWTQNWDAIVGKIYELNPDVTLICVGMYNPFRQLKISSDSLLEIGAAADGLVEAINSWSKYGSKYASRYTYVSIMGIESMCQSLGNTLTDDSFLSNFELNVHPSLLGHQQIAERVISAVPEKSAPASQSLLSAVVSSCIQTVVRKTNSLISKLSSIFR